MCPSVPALVRMTEWSLLYEVEHQWHFAGNVYFPWKAHEVLGELFWMFPAGRKELHCSLLHLVLGGTPRSSDSPRGGN